MRALLYTTGSPFARAIRIVLDELGLEYERREEITTPTVEERARAAPTLQVPTLWDGEVTLWESGLIVEYLMTEYSARPKTRPPLARWLWRPHAAWQDKLILATIQTLGTAATTISQMTWTGLDFRDNAHLTRCADRLPHLMIWLEERVLGPGNGFFPDAVSAQDIFLACHLRFIENRPIGLELGLERYPKVRAMLDRLDERKSFQRSPILWWEPGVTGYAEDGRTPLYETGAGE